MSKTYCCPFCKEKFDRKKLVDHIDKKHDNELPEHYTAYRAAYDIINNKPGHGFCIICQKPTKWNEKTQKYNRLCGKKECKDKIREVYSKNMLRVYNKTTLLDDPVHQEKMLAHRRISGTYTWSDGTKFTYTGSYEKEFLEFLDTVMNYDSSDIIAPGPILEYEFNGKKRHWITDFLIISANTIVEVKDGGSNPNKRSMPEYRAKQIAKEKMITNMGVYSYIRLTNNDFGQLLGILAELKKNIVDDDVHPLYRIHEEFQDLLDIDLLLSDTYPLLEALSQDSILDPINNLIKLQISQTFIDHPEEDYLVYEVATIKPKVISKILKEVYIPNYIKELNEKLHKVISERTELTIYYKDEHDRNQGIGIGIVF